MCLMLGPVERRSPGRCRFRLADRALFPPPSDYLGLDLVTCNTVGLYQHYKGLKGDSSGAD